MIFLNKYDNDKNIRFKSFKKTFELCFERNLKILVETGTARGKTKFFFIKKYNWKDGMSTPMFAEYAKFCNGMLHTCDISENNITNAKNFTKKLVSAYGQITIGNPLDEKNHMGPLIDKDAVITKLLQMIEDDSFPALKLYMEYRFGKPKETVQNTVELKQSL